MNGTTIFRGSRLFDGVSDSVLADGAFATADGRITWVGLEDDLPPAISNGAELVDLNDAFVMPGMIDAHVHLQTPLKGKGDLPLSYFEYIEYTALKAAYNAQVYLATGFTSVMDVGCRGNVAVALRDAIASGLAIGPRIVASGPPISPTGGLADDFQPFVHHDIVHGVVADSLDELRLAVRTQVKQGVDNVKIGVSGSSVKPTSNPYVSDMSAEAISTVVEEAHRAGCSVAAHCHPTQGFLDCLRSGVDTIHHAFHIDESCLEPFYEAKHAYLVPTVWKLRGTLEGAVAAGRSPDLMRPFAAASDAFSGLLKELIRNGASNRIAVGSDAGHVIAHGTTAKELSLLVELGMSAIQALTSATSVAAAAAGIGSLTGSLASGMAADFLVVDGDPLADIDILQDRSRLLSVYKDGELVAARGSVVARPDVDRPFPAISTIGRRHRGPITRRQHGAPT